LRSPVLRRAYAAKAAKATRAEVLLLKGDAMIRFEQTFMIFFSNTRRNITYPPLLILMDAMISAAKHIQHYYLTVP